MADEATSPRPSIGRELWNVAASRFTKGSTIKAREEEKRAKEQAMEKAAVPPPPDPRDVLLTVLASRDPETFRALLSTIESLSRAHAAERRESFASHPHMAFHEGASAGLDELHKKLTTLSGQGQP